MPTIMSNRKATAKWNGREVEVVGPVTEDHESFEGHTEGGHAKTIVKDKSTGEQFIVHSSEVVH